MPARIGVVHWVRFAVVVEMERLGILLFTSLRVFVPKSTDLGSKVSSAIVVESEMRIQELSTIQVSSLLRSAGGDLVPISIEDKRVGNGS